MNHELTKAIRIKLCRNEDPSTSIVDSQSVKTTEKGGIKGYDEEKKQRVEIDTLLQTQKVLSLAVMLARQTKMIEKK